MQPWGIRAILFDFDGTLTTPGALDFPKLKGELGCPRELPVLEFILALPPARRQAAFQLLDRFEEEAARRSLPNRGAEQTLLFLKNLGLPLAILTRNRRSCVRRALGNFRRIREGDFRLIVARDEGIEPKPSPEGIRWVAAGLGIESRQLLVVGDFSFDVEAGRAAGAVTVFLTNGAPCPPLAQAPDFVIEELPELCALVPQLLPLPLGKLANEELDRILSSDPPRDASLLVGPGVGEDCAVLKPPSGEHLVWKSDPITFTTDRLARYLLDVNSNDLLTAGARPRWFLATVLLPPQTNLLYVRHLIKELRHECRRHAVTLCGGHTEVTEAVTRPLVVGQLLGTVPPRRLIRKQRLREGDLLVLSKSAGLEGTAILATELASRLHRLGLQEEELEAARRMVEDPGISVRREAEVAARTAGVSALHDVTEGGVATALQELSRAGGHRLLVRPAEIPVLDLTRKICALLGLDALGLIGSGSLLMACRPAAVPRLLDRLRRAGVPARVIGKVGRPGRGVQGLDARGRRIRFPLFQRDELARALEEA